MADTVQITAGTGTVVGTDEVTIGATTQHVQRVKLVDGADGGTELLPGTAAKGLAVEPRPTRKRITVTPTVSTAPAYTAKDAVGALLTFANAARVSGGSIVLEAVQLHDKDQELKDYDLVFFDRSITAPTDNAVFAPTDTELGYVVAVVPILSGMYADLSTNAIAAVQNLAVPIVLNGTDLYAVLVARGTPTFTATTDVSVTVTITQD